MQVLRQPWVEAGGPPCPLAWPLCPQPLEQALRHSQPGRSLLLPLTAGWEPNALLYKNDHFPNTVLCIMSCFSTKAQLSFSEALNRRLDLRVPPGPAEGLH